MMGKSIGELGVDDIHGCSHPKSDGREWACSTPEEELPHLGLLYWDANDYAVCHSKEWPQVGRPVRGERHPCSSLHGVIQNGGGDTVWLVCSSCRQ